MTAVNQRPIVQAIVAQHAEDTAALRVQRSVLVAAPHVELHRLARLDERLYAHLDGLMVAGDAGYRLAQEAIEVPGVGQLFALAVLAIERQDRPQIDRLLALVDALPDAARGLASAFGWVSSESLRGFTAPLLTGAEPLQRWLGIAACAAHRVDAGKPLDQALSAADARERALALKAAGTLGRTERVAACIDRLADPDPACRYHAAAAATLLGSEKPSAEALRGIALAGGPHSLRALELHLLASAPARAREVVRTLAADSSQRRRAIQAAGWAGDVQVVPWLIQQMQEPDHARVAGESFMLLTGANLAQLDLELKGDAPAAAGPTDNLEDGNVALDEDESLPWPDVAAVQAWWQRNADRFPVGVRCFAGAEATAAQCLQVLKTAGQRQRHAAALLLSLMKPGAALFNVAAPAPRQQRLLGLPVRVM